MIPHIRWPDPHMDENQSPFQRGAHERPLRVTIHVQSLQNLTGEDAMAYQVIRELGTLDEVDIVATSQDSFPYFRINSIAAFDGYFNVDEVNQDQVISSHHGIHPSRLSADSIQRLIAGATFDDAKLQLIQSDLEAVEAHWSVQRDIFVTLSPEIINHRDKFGYANIVTPKEASFLIGLLLRSCVNWVYQKTERATCSTDRGMFYLVLTRSRLPAFWRYFAGCVYTQDFLGDDLLFLGQSVLERCVRAVQARDAIGQQFYRLQDRNTEDSIMYHFDYLTLLLAGAFDAQAVIVNRIYNLVPNEFDAKFTNKEFLKKLRSQSARLHKVVTSPKCRLLKTLLSRLRNTIHSTGLTTYGFSAGGGQQQSFIELPESIRDDVWQASQKIGSPDDWGLKREEYRETNARTKVPIPRIRLSLEPYTYATRLLDEWLNFLNEIAEATEVEKLYIGRSMPNLPDKPPADWDNLISRFSALG